ncbi:MAG TPA: hypothetical protein VHR45_21020 [Thermoanaerobaculia bacterium]|nr:hypothetical protein [Thermoanaerobaculia bacterium]
MTLWAHILRLLHAGALWRDEAGAVGIATLPSLRAVFAGFPHESFALAVPMAIRLYTCAAGDSDPALRRLGMAVGLAIGGALWLSARLCGRHLPLLSLALTAGSASFVVFGDSLRGYGLGSLGIVLAFAALSRLLVRPGAWCAVAALLAVLFAVHCLLANWALVAALCAAALVTALRHGRRRVALAVLAIGVAAALSVLPYVVPLIAAAVWNVVAVDASGLGRVVGRLGTAAGPAGAVWLLLMGLALGATAKEESTPAPARLFCALVMLMGTAAQLLLLEVLSYTPRDWYYLPLLALAAAALEPLVADLAAAPWAKLARIGLALLGAAGLVAFNMPRLRERMTNVDLVARRLATLAASDDLVLVSPWYLGISFSRYYRGPANWVTVPDIPDHRFNRYDLLKVKLAEARPLAGVMDEAQQALAAGRRVWVVGQLHVPSGAQAPTMLPPAPGAPSGWRDSPYLRSWSLQLSAFLRDHAASLESVPVPAPDPVSRYEDLSLAVARGWRREPPRAGATPDLMGAR